MPTAVPTAAPAPAASRPRADDRPDPGADGGASARRWPGRWAEHHHVLAVAVVLLAIVPIVLAGVWVLRQPWLPTGDQAVIELRVHDVGRATPLVGPYSRYGWSHPGPLLYFLLAVPFRVLGNSSSALLLTTAVVNALAVAGLAAVAWRRGRLPLVLTTLVGVSLLVRSFGPELLRDPWNPYITLLPLALFVFVAWSIGEGDRTMLIPGALLGTFLVQTHVGYLPLVVAVAGWCAVALRRRVRERRRAAEPPLELRRPLALAGLASFVLWLPVLIDQVTATHNLTAIAEFFAGSERAPVGFATALGLAARELAGKAPWLGGIEPIDALSGAVEPAPLLGLLLPLAVFAATALLARRAGERARSALRLQGLVALVLFVAYVSLARVTDTVYHYLLRNWWVLAMLLWVSAAWSLWCVLHTVRLRVPARIAAPVGLAGGLVAMLFAVIPASWAVADAPLPESGWQGPLSAVVDPVVAAVPARSTVLVRGVGLSSNSVTDGLALQLERTDHHVVIDSDDANKFGARRTTAAPSPALTVWVVGDRSIEQWERRDDMVAVASWDPLAPSERALWRVDAHTLSDQLAASAKPGLVANLDRGESLFEAHGLDGVDQALLDRVEQGRSRGEPVTVFLGPPPDAGTPR